jgi:hypothetical protein
VPFGAKPGSSDVSRVVAELTDHNMVFTTSVEKLGKLKSCPEVDEALERVTQMKKETTRLALELQGLGNLV